MNVPELLLCPHISKCKNCWNLVMLIVIKLTSSHPNSMVCMHINVYGVNICLKMLLCVINFELCFEVFKEKGIECARIVTLCMNFQLVSLERYSLSDFMLANTKRIWYLKVYWQWSVMWHLGFRTCQIMEVQQLPTWIWFWNGWPYDSLTQILQFYWKVLSIYRLYLPCWLKRSITCLRMRPLLLYHILFWR